MSLHDQASPKPESPEPWERRQRDPANQGAAQILERAARHLILDQMRPDRTFCPGAADAVTLLWKAIEEVAADHATHQRMERLAAHWLPKHVVARLKRSEIFLH